MDRQPTDYVRNKSTTRSWPVIHRNNSYRYQLQPTVHNHRRQQSHQYYQYDYDALTGLNYPPNDTNNNINYSTNEDYLVSSSYDKSPSIDSYYYQHYRPSMQQSTTTMTTNAGQGGATITSTAHHQTQSGTTCCMMPPPVLFLFFTLLMTSSATAMLCAAIMTDHWEHVSWNREHLDRLSNKSSIELQWYLDGRAAKFSVSDMHRKSGDGRSRELDLPRYVLKHNKPLVDKRANVFLVPMNGGIWTLCIDLTPEEIRSLSGDGFPQVDQCVNYLAGSTEGGSGGQINEENSRAEWQHRMQNLSISCSLVCLIILGSAALVGAFGVCQRQISAVLVTGVMYLLAALFALFTLMIIHFKRQQGRPLTEIDYGVSIDGVVAVKPDYMYAQPLLDARVIVTAWSLNLGWGGVVLCAFTSFLWILLSKIMRFNPLSAMI